MKEKHKFKERFLALALVFVMVLGMIIEPVQIQAAPGDGESVTITPASIELAPGGSGQLTANVTPDGTTVTWKSSKPEVAEVNGTGNVTAIKPGTTTITAETSNGTSGTATVTVKESFYTLTGTVKADNGAGIEGAQVSIQGVQNYSATTDANGNYSVQCPNGTYTVTATMPGMTMQGAGETVTVSDGSATVSDIALHLNDIQLNTGTVTSIKVDEEAAWSITKDFSVTGENITWSADRDNVVAFTPQNDGSVKITGLYAGSTKITATVTTKYGTKTASEDITVGTWNTTTSLAVAPKGTGKVESVELTANVIKSDGNPVTGGDVEFIIFSKKKNESYKEVDRATRSVSAGKSVYEFNPSDLKYGLAGDYKFSVSYQGYSGKYNSSIATPVEVNYKDAIPIEFVGVDINQKTPEVTYGDKDYQIIVDNEAFEEKAGDIEPTDVVEYTFKVHEDSLSQEVLIVSNDGIVNFKKACEGQTVYVTVTRKGIGDHSEISVDYPIEVNKKVINIDTTYEGLTYSKIYDGGDRTVKENVDNKDLLTNVGSIPLNGYETGEEVRVSEIEGTLPEGTKNAGSYNVDVKLNKVVLDGANKDNYKVDLEKAPVSLKTAVTINKREIRLKVSKGSREYGHWNEVLYEGEPVEEDTTAYKNKDIQGLVGEDTVEFPEPTEVDIDEADKPDYPIEVPQAGKLTVYATTDTGSANGNPGKNYFFNFTDVKNGDLTVTKEQIENYMDYLNFGDASNAYISEQTGKIWVNAQNNSFEVRPKDIAPGSYYDQVRLSDGTNISEDGKGIDLSSEEFEDGDQKKIEVYLYNSKNDAKSKEFNISLSVDVSDAVVESTSISEEVHGIPEVFDKITFGRFHKKLSEIVETATVSDGEGSGVNSWSYNVMTGASDDDFTKESIEKYIDPVNTTCTWELVSEKVSGEDNATLSGTIPIPSKENNYVVLLQLKDNVGHSKVYASNGVVVDYVKPGVSITLDQEQSSTGVYGTDVQLNIHVQDVVSQLTSSASAVQKVEVSVKSNGEETANETLFDIHANPEKAAWTLEELAAYRSMDLSYTVNAADNNSNNVTVTATVWDNAENTNSYTYSLMIDTTDPVIETTYENTAKVQNGKYYKAPMKATIVYTERNFSKDKQYLWFDVQAEGKEIGTYSVQELQSELGIKTQWEQLPDEVQQDDANSKDLTDTRQHKLILTFDVDNHYVFTPHIKDLAKFTENEIASSEKNDFVIDTKDPQINVRYEVTDGAELTVPDQEENRVYRNTPVRAIVTIDEHNFALDGQDIQAEVDVKATNIGKGETVPDYNAQEKVNNGEVWKQQNVDTYTSVYTFNADANYTHGITYTDLAGNTVTYGPGYFTVDKTKPTGTVEIKGFGFWESLLEKITFGLFSPSTVDVVVTGADHTSPVNPVQYARFHDQMTREELEAYRGWSFASADKPESAAFSVSPDEQFIVYTRVTDYAGNYEYFSSDGMIVDSTKPAPVVTVTNLSQSQNGIFNEDVTLRIDVEDPTAGDTYSGLERVWYTVSATGNVNTSETIELLNNSNNKVQGNKTFSQIITVPANVYNSNDVKVQAFAEDFSSNRGESAVEELKIDVTNPTISVAWDLNNPLNGRYYKDTRTATVTVTDRNFDPNNVRFSITNTDGTAANISGWSSSNIGISDTATSTCQVSFPADGDYTFTLGCTDLAGNSGEYGQTDEFTIDKTVPVVTVSYDNNSAKNGNYFKEARTATVTIREHNFNAGDVRAAITASLQGRGTSAPSISGFSDSGDVHTATVRYAADGDYTFDIDYADMAGNQAADYTQDNFTVDLTAPEVEIIDIQDKSANNDVVAPGVKATDVNYDAKNVTITLTGTNNGKVDIGKVVSSIENGQSIKMNDFAREEKMDDLYKLSAKAVDMAGNETEKSVMFSVNRYGSVYVLDEDTAKEKDGWLSTKDYTYIREEQDLGVIEYNVDTIESNKVVVNRDGELANLKENQDYTVKSTGSDAQWKETHYVIKASNFAEEGNYSVVFNTRDRANNSMNNTSVKKSNKNLPIEFTVDKTAPTVVVSGVEDGGQYRSAERSMTVDAKDNLALAKVTVNVDGEENTYTAEELRETDGIIETGISSANKWQEISITAEDEAGNKLGQTKENAKEQPVVINVLVTPNIAVQYFMNKPLFYGSIAVILAVAALIVFLVWKKKNGSQAK